MFCNAAMPCSRSITVYSIILCCVIYRQQGTTFTGYYWPVWHHWGPCWVPRCYSCLKRVYCTGPRLLQLRWPPEENRSAWSPVLRCKFNLQKLIFFRFLFFWLIWNHISGQKINMEEPDRFQNSFKWSQSLTCNFICHQFLEKLIGSIS